MKKIFTLFLFLNLAGIISADTTSDEAARKAKIEDEYKMRKDLLKQFLYLEETRFQKLTPANIEEWLLLIDQISELEGSLNSLRGKNGSIE